MAPSPNRSSPALLWSVILIAVVALALFAGRRVSHEAVGVKVAKMQREDLMRTVSTNGKVEPILPFQAHAPFAGVVQRVFVEVGRKVRAGDALVSMSDTDARAHVASAIASLRTAEASSADQGRGGTQEEQIALAADLKRAQLQQGQSEKDLAALQALQVKGAASASEVEAARLRLESARTSSQQIQERSAGRFSQADRARTAAQLAEAQAALGAATGTLKTVNIHAPFAGTVYSVPISPYDFVPGGDDLLDLADLNRLQVRAYFDEPEIGQLAPGQTVRIVWDAKPNETWHGHITIAPTTVVTYNTRSVGECIITVDDARGELLPNTNVTVTVTTSERKNVLSIPREALHTEGMNNFVYRVINNKLVSTPVQIGVSNLKLVEITGGLSAGDTVALGATTDRELADGLEVRPVS